MLLFLAFTGLHFVALAEARPHSSLATSYQATTASIDVSSAVGFTSDRYVGYNFDWHASSEEYPAWLNCSVQVIDFDNNYLKTAVSNLPTRLRIGGSEEDQIIYNVFGTECTRYNTSSDWCLTMSRWHQIVNFTSFHNISLIFGLNAVTFRENNSAPYNFTNIANFLQYNHDNNLSVFGFEFGNELPSIDPTTDAQDYITLKSIIDSIWSESSGANDDVQPYNSYQTKPKLIGNDLNPDASYLNTFLPLVCNTSNSAHEPALDIMTYHNYDGYGLDSNLSNEIMTPKFLEDTYTKVADVIDTFNKYCSGNGVTELYVGETAAAWHSGQYNTTNAFESSFWYADALGRLATLNHTGFLRQTLIGGNYGLLSHWIPSNYTGLDGIEFKFGDNGNGFDMDYVPNPDYYTALLFNKLVSDKMLKVDLSNDGGGYLRAYSYCSARNGSQGDVGLLLINIASDVTFNVSVGLGGFEKNIFRMFETVKSNVRKVDVKTGAEKAADSWTVWELTAQSLRSRVMELNGKELIMESPEQLPCVVECGVEKTANAAIVVNPLSIVFVEMSASGAPSVCGTSV